MINMTPRLRACPQASPLNRLADQINSGPNAQHFHD